MKIRLKTHKHNIMIIVLFSTFILQSILFALNSAAYSLNDYGEIITNDPNDGSTPGTNISTELYVSFADFTVWVYPTNIPLYNADEDENRDWSVYTQVRLPRYVQFGSSVVQDDNITMPDQSVSQNIDVYITQAGNSLTQTQNTVGTIFNSIYEKFVSYDIVPSPGAFGDISYFLTGSSYYNKYILPNGSYLEQCFSIKLPSNGAYTIDAKGVYYLRRGDIAYEVPVEHFASYLPIDEDRERIALSPSLFNVELPGGITDFDEGVFVGSVFIGSYSNEPIYPTFVNYFSNDYKFHAEVVSSDLTGAFLKECDPILSYNYSALDLDSGVLEITSNGYYGVDRYRAVNVNVPQEITWGGMFDWIFDSIGAFMGFEIAPGWTIGVIMSIIVGLAIAIWAIRVFMGG